MSYGRSRFQVKIFQPFYGEFKFACFLLVILVKQLMFSFSLLGF